MNSAIILAAIAGLAMVAAPAGAQETPPAFGEAAVDGADLGAVTGRADVGSLIARADQQNVVAGNSVVGTSTTGTVAIDGNAFQNLQGLAVISANSGNNVAMNAAMNVTINMAPR